MRVGLRVSRVAVADAQLVAQPELIESAHDGNLDEFVKLVRVKLHCDRNCKGSDYQVPLPRGRVASAHRWPPPQSLFVSAHVMGYV